MRIAVLTAALLAISGCSAAPESAPPLTPITPKSPATSSAAPSSTTTTTTSKSATTSAVPEGGPTAETPIEDTLAWVEAGAPATPDAFHTATRDNETTQLGDDVAFVTPSATAKCMTDAKSEGALACLVDLSDPPAEPEDSYGQWIGGWVDFPGDTLQIGSSRADPGRFAKGNGAELPYGSSLRFGDYQCRSDRAGLFCVNFAHRSGAKFAATGVEPLGCLRAVGRPDTGQKFSC